MENNDSNTLTVVPNSVHHHTDRREVSLVNEGSPLDLVRKATDVAEVCRRTVLVTTVNIKGKRYVQAEGWMTIAVAHGCVLSAVNIEKVDGGIRAIGQVRNNATGAVVAEAEGFVGDDEPTWSSRPEYARRAMAQTRAMSRAARSAFAHVVVMIDAGLSTTPAEEVPNEGFEEKQQYQNQNFTQRDTLSTSSDNCWTGKVIDVETFEGIGKTGKPYTRYTVVFSGDRKASTLNRSLADLAVKFGQDHSDVIAQVQPYNTAYNLLNITADQTEEVEV